jgi:hypothetical protein
MATRGGLYPELSVQDFLTFSGTYDCHLAFLVNAGLDGLLDLNRIVFYPVSRVQLIELRSNVSNRITIKYGPFRFQKLPPSSS